MQGAEIIDPDLNSLHLRGTWKIVQEPKFKKGQIVARAEKKGSYVLYFVAEYKYDRLAYVLTSRSDVENHGGFFETSESLLISLDEFMDLQDTERGE